MRTSFDAIGFGGGGGEEEEKRKKKGHFLAVEEQIIPRLPRYF